MTNNAHGWEAVERAARDSLAITWDECHKIYLVMDAGQIRDFTSYGYDLIFGSTEEKVALLRLWYERSCFLRFISAVWTNEADPNEGFADLIPQGWIDEDEQCFCADCCSQGHCSCEKCNEPCTCESIDPTCDECGISCEDAPEWCGNCGNCMEHCADYEGCTPSPKICCPPCDDNEHAGDLDNPGYCDCCGGEL